MPPLVAQGTPHGALQTRLEDLELPPLVTRDAPAVFTVCGGGNSAHVLAAVLGSVPGWEVRLWDVLGHEVALFRERLARNDHTITVRYAGGATPPTRGRVARVSADASDVLPGADVVILAVPAFAHATYLDGVSSYVRGHPVHLGCMVAEGGFDFAAQRALRGTVAGSVFSFDTLPWACRVVSFGEEAEVLGTKASLDLSVFPSSGAPALRDMVRGMLAPRPGPRSPDVRLSTFLSATLMNINGVLHPCLSYGRYAPDKPGGWDQETPFDRPPLFYGGADEFAAAVVSAVSDEVLEVRARAEAALGAELPDVVHVHDWFLRSYPRDIGDPSSLLSCMLTNDAYRGLTHPTVAAPGGGYLPDFGARYFTEDIPFGLCVQRGVAEILGVPTPHADRVLRWAQGRMGKEYLDEAGRMAGRDLAETRAPQAFGIRSVAQLAEHVPRGH